MIQKKIGVQLTKRDIDIIGFINEFGFCEMPQIERRFGIKKPLSYRLMRRLIRAELISHRRVYHGGYGIYYLTAQGARGTDLPAMSSLAIGRYEHQLRVTDIYIKLREKYPETEWISERRLKHDKYYDGLGKRGHVSDGILVLPDEKKIAIEVELSLKAKERIRSILKNYATQFAIHEVWYFCSPGLVKVLSTLATKMSFAKIHDLEKFMYE